MIKNIVKRIPISSLAIYEIGSKDFRVSISNDFHIILATKDVLDEYELDTAYKKRLISAIDNKDCCFIITCNKKIIHHSLVSLNKRYRPPIDCTYICRNSIYIYDCWTEPNYRGRTIYPFMLQYICNYFKKDKLSAFMDIWSNNKSSIRGAKRAGFKKISSVIIIKIQNLKIVIIPNKLNKYISNNKLFKIQFIK